MDITDHTPNSVDVVFIEYHLSKLPRCQSPLSRYAKEESDNILIAAPQGMVESIIRKDDLYFVEYWTEEGIGEMLRDKGFEIPNLNYFAKACKLLICDTLKVVEKPFVIFTTSHVIKTLCPTLEEELPRKVRCETYYLSAPYDKSYVCFDREGMIVRNSLDPLLKDILKTVSVAALTS
ncbi:MAG: hypothetical protein JWL92_601 [Candidatus Nomurabacteria bacterium]|nr:hypothetical protein [Candidatus Nomurabacteria bacterium]